jgi:hypothetical protein
VQIRAAGAACAVRAIGATETVGATFTINQGGHGLFSLFFSVHENAPLVPVVVVVVPVSLSHGSLQVQFISGQVVQLFSLSAVKFRSLQVVVFMSNAYLPL